MSGKEKSTDPGLSPPTERYFETPRHKRISTIMPINGRRFMRTWNVCGMSD